MRFFEGNSAVRAPMILAQWEFWAHRDPEAPWSPSFGKHIYPEFYRSIGLSN
jgi:hypothetical protein